MPTSLRTPVVRPARRCAATPRSGPAKRSSARPIAATGATRGSSAPTTQPTSGSRRPRWLVASGPKARRTSRSWRAAVGEPGEVAPGRAVAQRELDLRDAQPCRQERRTSSAPRSRSRRRPGSRRGGRGGTAPAGRTAARAALARFASRISTAAVRLTMPKPPPCCSANAATARSDSCSSSGRRSPTDRRRRGAAGRRRAARSASASAWPLPRRGSRRTRAPAASASAAVRSREPSSATITSASGNCSRRAATVAPMRPSSSRAATRIDEALSHPTAPRARCRARRRPCASSSRRTGPATAPPSSSARASRPGLRVEVVHAREIVLGEGVDRGRPGPRHLDTDRRDVLRGEPS